MSIRCNLCLSGTHGHLTAFANTSREKADFSGQEPHSAARTALMGSKTKMPHQQQELQAKSVTHLRTGSFTLLQDLASHPTPCTSHKGQLQGTVASSGPVSLISSHLSAVALLSTQSRDRSRASGLLLRWGREAPRTSHHKELSWNSSHCQVHKSSFYIP